MATSLPYMNAYGKISQILEKAASAQKPPKFTQDFLETKLGFKSTSDRAIIPLLIKMNFLSGDRTPTDLFSKFKNSNERKAAIAEGMRKAYAQIFEVNEYAYEADKNEVEGIFAQVTGMGTDEPSFKAMVNTFLRLRDMADFESKAGNETASESEDTEVSSETKSSSNNAQLNGVLPQIGLSYSINLKLPETTDVEVYDAIFKSLKENLLRG
ncbi:DUF5343 domain-containing protein [Pyruvatibacter mobilis]|uniref:DUF5343 domain-containing protein n=1 Tax=Pyruvatibacter mobilis TaxID=1712261 RepID=UPI003C7EC1D2